MFFWGRLFWVVDLLLDFKFSLALKTACLLSSPFPDLGNEIEKQKLKLKNEKEKEKDCLDFCVSF